MVINSVFVIIGLSMFWCLIIKMFLKQSITQNANKMGQAATEEQSDQRVTSFSLSKLCIDN